MRRALPAIAWAVALFALSSIPGDDLTMQPGVPHFDKFAHLGLYVVFGVLLARAVPAGMSSPPGLPSARRWAGALAVLAIGMVYGASDEWHQSFVAGRACSFWDWVTDCVGTALGLAGWSAVGALRGGRRAAVAPAAGPEA